ncbi:hypothetical protein A5765_16925 [Mycolicibacterium celeriflavum]|uniref:SRPBCC family protein n=1 Tax=Mycolicibacterium celeriflavum TaxID=1249101 RepID=UPI0007FDBC47|nr:SRPBCC domain-containing protein [Mycolicibacterium celeriflavum]OBG11780.1 hypothetical protein A5765_16925 [Mycolicibacterium celeriflavum]
MSDNSLTIDIVVPNTPEEVFEAVTNVDKWWSEGIDGETAAVGGEFTFTDFTDLWCRFRLTEVTPPRRMVWQVVDSRLDFVEDHTEWTGTQVIFDITPNPGGTSLRFTHEGLRPTVECYEACSRGWDFYINRSLPNLLTAGAADPIRKP